MNDNRLIDPLVAQAWAAAKGIENKDEALVKLMLENAKLYTQVARLAGEKVDLREAGRGLYDAMKFGVAESPKGADEMRSALSKWRQVSGDE